MNIKIILISILSLLFFALTNCSEKKKVEYINYACLDTGMSPSHFGSWFKTGGTLTITKDEWGTSISPGGYINKSLSNEYNYVSIDERNGVTKTVVFNTITESGYIKIEFNPKSMGTSGQVNFKCKKK
jgi:hypothetical protein